MPKSARTLSSTGGWRIITGESLYWFVGDLAFVKDFKDRADEYDPNLGLVYADNDPEHKGEHLDQELLVCPTPVGDQEFGFFSMFGFSMRRLDKWVEGHNEELTMAQRPATYKRVEMDEDKIVVEIDPSLFIDKAAIKPDQEAIDEHTKKLKEIFWNFGD